MSWAWATLALIVSVPFVVWPLLRHWQPSATAAPAADPHEARRSEFEEIESDLAAGRLSEREAAFLRRELQ